MPKLTPELARDTRPATADVLLFDSGPKACTGLALKVTPTGRRIFLFQYRSPVEKGKRRRVTIGTLGGPLELQDGRSVALTVDAARMEARRLLGIVQARRDPFLESITAARTTEQAVKVERARASGQTSMRDLARDFLADRTADDKSPVTLYEYGRLIDKHFLPVTVAESVTFGDRPAAEIGATDVEAIRRQLALRGKRILANRVQQLGRSLMNYAERVDARPHGQPNPFGAVRWHVEQETRQALTRDEIAALHSALATLDDGRRGEAVDCIRFLLYSGMRKREAFTLRWDAIDFTAGTATLGRTKTGRSVRPLSREALAVLAAIPRRGPYVFPGRGGPDTPREDVRRTWDAARTLAGIAKPLHSLRHTVGTVALSEGVPLAAVGAILGQRSAVSTMRYAKMELSKAREAADVAGAALGRALHPMDVVPIRRRRKKA
jgi:integrase